MKLTILFTALLPSLISAHFQLSYPAVRGFVEDKLGTFPCGGQDSVSKTRTLWPLTGGPIQLEMEHDRVAVQVLLGVGEDVGDNFNIVLLPTIEEEGEGNFCLGDVVIPASLNLTDGTNATIQVVTSGDPNGGLYNCADITLTSNAPSPPTCKNGTITVTQYMGKFANANGTDDQSGSASPSSSSSSTSSSGGATPAATGKSGAVRGAGVAWGILGAVGVWGWVLGGGL